MLRARMIGVGAAAPKKILTNHDLEKIVDTNDEWITTRSGIKQRRIATEEEVTSDFATVATKAALEMAGIKAADLDIIVLGTASPDMPLPATACFVQRNIGAKKAAAFDVIAGCSGFLYALSVGEQFVRSGAAKNVAVIGVEVLSKFLNWKDRTTCILFGDGGGTVILRAEEITDKKQSQIYSTHIHSDGDGWNLITIPGGGTVNPSSYRTVDEGMHAIRMQGKETFKLAVRNIADVAVEAMEANGVTKDEVSHLISHQANSRIIDAVVDRLGLPKEKVHMNLDRYGNTSAGSVPLGLDEAVRSGKVKTGDVMIMTAFGSGLTWGSALARW